MCKHPYLNATSLLSLNNNAVITVLQRDTFFFLLDLINCLQRSLLEMHVHQSICLIDKSHTVTWSIRQDIFFFIFFNLKSLTMTRKNFHHYRIFCLQKLSQSTPVVHSISIFLKCMTISILMTAFSKLIMHHTHPVTHQS